MRAFQREPALALLPVLASVIGLLAHYLNWSQSTTALVTTLAVAAGGVVAAYLTRPWAPAGVTAAVTALLTVISGYWLHLNASAISGIAILVTMGLGLLVRHQVTPVAVPASAP